MYCVSFTLITHQTNITHTLLDTKAKKHWTNQRNIKKIGVEVFFFNVSIQLNTKKLWVFFIFRSPLVNRKVFFL